MQRKRPRRRRCKGRGRGGVDAKDEGGGVTPHTLGALGWYMRWCAWLVESKEGAGGVGATECSYQGERRRRNSPEVQRTVLPVRMYSRGGGYVGM